MLNQRHINTSSSHCTLLVSVCLCVIRKLVCKSQAYFVNSEQNLRAFCALPDPDLAARTEIAQKGDKVCSPPPLSDHPADGHMCVLSRGPFQLSPSAFTVRDRCSASGARIEKEEEMVSSGL